MFLIVVYSNAYVASARRLHPAVLAGRWAVVSLAATLISGAWLRAAIVWPSLAQGVHVPFGVHAHSHVAFFGWLVLAVASLAARQVAWTERAAQRWRWVVHVLGALSLVALVAFAAVGYDTPTIVLSAVHVLLWFPLVRLVWSMEFASVGERAWWHAAWISLLAAGAATLIPGVLAARGVRTGWWREFGIKLFLALFLNGFAGLSTMGILLAGRGRDIRGVRSATWARRLIGASLLPLAVLYVATPPPLPWMVWIGRAAVGVVGASTIVVVVLAWRCAHSLWTRAAIMALGLVGVLEGVAAAGVGDQLMHSRPITIAFTHVLLLLGVTPILAAALAGPHAPRWRPLLATIGAVAMCSALVAFGWRWLGAYAVGAGLSPMELLTFAAIGGALAAAAWLSLLPLLFGAPAPEVRP
ncbi:MAG: hypothetical protein ABMA00_11615 [Gemmatimonas sp.]